MLAFLATAALGGAPHPEPEPDPEHVEAPQSAATPSATEPSGPPAPREPRFLEPRRIPPRDQSPRAKTRNRYRNGPPLLRPALRVSPGFSGRLTGRPYAGFSFDTLASLIFGLHHGRRQFGLAPEIGYSLRAPGLDQDLLGGLGLVYGINVEEMSVGLLPRFVTQFGPDGTGYGLRTGLWYDFAENGFSVEVGHQWIQRTAGDTHELRAMVSLDLLMLMLVLTDARMEWI